MGFSDPAAPEDVTLAPGSSVTTDPADASSTLVLYSGPYSVGSHPDIIADGIAEFGPFYVGDRDFLQLYFAPAAGLNGWYVSLFWQASEFASIADGRTSYDSYGGIEIADTIPILSPYVRIEVQYTAAIPPAAVPSAHIVVISRKGFAGLWTPIGNSSPLHMSSGVVAAGAFSPQTVVRPITTGPARFSVACGTAGIGWAGIIQATNRFGNVVSILVMDHWTLPALVTSGDSRELFLPGQRLHFMIYNAGGAAATFDVALLVPYRA